MQIFRKLVPCAHSSMSPCVITAMYCVRLILYYFAKMILQPPSWNIPFRVSAFVCDIEVQIVQKIIYITVEVWTKHQCRLFYLHYFGAIIVTCCPLQPFRKTAQVAEALYKPQSSSKDEISRRFSSKSFDPQLQKPLLLLVPFLITVFAKFCTCPIALSTTSLVTFTCFIKLSYRQ